MAQRIRGSVAPADGERGAALVIALFVLTVLTVLGVLTLNTSIVELRMSANQRISAQVFYAAEAGLERGLKNLIQDFENDHAAGSPWANSNWAVSGTISQTAVSGSAAFDPATRTMDMYLNSPSVRRLNFPGGTTVGNSSYALYLYTPSATEAFLLSHATGLGGTAAVEYHLKVDDVSPYNNAIFTGAGITGHFLGSVNVAGSVYSRGNLTPAGNVFFANNYDDGNHGGMLPALRALLPAVSDLEAKIRVKGGDFTLGGSATVGSASANGSMAGVYVDGSTNVTGGGYYYDEFSAEVPDVPVPTILDGLKGQFGTGIVAASGYSGPNPAVAQSIYADWARGTGVFTGQGTSGVVINGNLTIDKNTNSFSNIDGNGNGIVWDKAAKRLTVQGNVVITGNFTIGQPPQLGAIDYVATGANTGAGSNPEGGATLFCGGNVRINSTFAPTSTGYLRGGVNTNSLGVVTASSVTFDGSPGDHYTGFYYAETQVNFNKQASFGGTVIGGVVNWAQVPDVSQVPALRDYLPPGMPGGFNIMAFTSREWRRVY